MAGLADALAEKSRLAPGRAEYLLDLGQLRYIQGDAAGARAYFTEALRRDPRNEFATAWLKHLEGG
jgi:cytochrome c-type biogenesis protein CcmH/NrfG